MQWMLVILSDSTISIHFGFVISFIFGALHDEVIDIGLAFVEFNAESMLIRRFRTLKTENTRNLWTVFWLCFFLFFAFSSFRSLHRSELLLWFNILIRAASKGYV